MHRGLVVRVTMHVNLGYRAHLIAADDFLVDASLDHLHVIIVTDENDV